MASEKWVGESTPYLTPDGDTWGRDAASKGRVGSQRIVFAGEVTPPEFADKQLAMEAGEAVVMRRRLILLDGQPVEIADSYWPASIAAGTPLAEPGRIRGGAVAQLATMGYLPAAVTEEIATRPATAEEVQLLSLEPTEWVLVLMRAIADQAGRAYELSVMVTPGRARRLKYEMRVS